jgi:multicomponent Na+:H+ antiporter subunit D
VGCVTEQVVVAPLLVALVTAIVCLLARSAPRFQRAVSLLGSVAYLGAVAALFDAVGPNATLTYQLSNWQAPYGITLVADSLSVFMLAFSAVVSLFALVYSLRTIDETGQRLSYHALYHLMMVGVTGSFLTGDIFNLFVWFEVMLMSSYVLVVFYSGAEQTRAALQYVVLNLVGGAIMLVAIGGIYSVTGTLNMADLARRLANPGEYGLASADLLPVLGLSALLFAVFALKTGLVPFQWWVPAAYSAAPAPVSAMLAGVVKKVGVYAIVRLYFTVFSGMTIPGGLGFPGLSGNSALAFYGPVLFVMAAASVFVGGFGAVSRDDLDELLAYSSIGQVGFIVLPMAVAATVVGFEPLPGTELSVATVGVAATLVYSLNHALAKGSLFLVSGVVEELTGSTDLRELGGIASSQPTLAAGFFLGGLGLVGIPPLSGFFAKFLVFDTAARAATLGAPGAELALAVALAGAVLTIAYFTRAWNRGFWGERSALVADAHPETLQVALAVALAVGVVVVGIGFDPVFDAAVDAAGAALDRAGYVEAVDPAVPDGGGDG